MNIPTIPQCLENVQYKHILLDTCFLVDFSRAIDNKELIYRNLVKDFQKNNNIFVTISPVAIEFFKSSDLPSDLRKKRNYFEDLISHTLPLDQTIIKNSYRLVALYRKFGKDISSTDFLLGATLMRYPKIYLLTRDHNDFPVKIFDRCNVIPIQHEEGGIDTYALFKYSDKKATNIEQQLLFIDKKAQIK